jgi:hypothetical protein
VQWVADEISIRGRQCRVRHIFGVTGK